MFSPHHFPCPYSCLQNKEKESNQSDPKSNLRLGTDCPDPLPGCLPSVALECSSSTVDESRITSTNTSRQLIWCWLFTLKLPSMDE
ncbi:hypothetical protein ACFX1Q_035169 [Malus domestica]